MAHIAGGGPPHIHNGGVSLINTRSRSELIMIRLSSNLF